MRTVLLGTESRIVSRATWLVIVLILASVSVGEAWAAGTLRITVIDVGQGDATLVESPSGQTLLFDGGKSGRGEDVIVPLMQSRGITSLTYMVASHYHADHIGGLDEVFELMPVTGAAYDRGWSYTTITYNTYATAVASKRTTLAPGQVIDLGEGVTATCVTMNSAGVLSAPYDNGSYENEYDVCLLVEYGGFDYFQAGDLTGNPSMGCEDIETPAANLTGDIDVYHVNHHGSDTSSTAYFLQTVTPEVSIISVGSNGYGHPTQSVLNRLVTYGSFVYQTETGSGGTLPATDLKVVGGHVDITTDGVGYYYVDGDQWAIDETSPAPEPLPAAFRLLGNVPNPFNPSTEIRFVTTTGGPGQLDVFDLTGRTVFGRALTAGVGMNSVRWYGRDNEGAQVSGGVYLYRVSTPDGVGLGRMLLLK